MTIKGNCGNCCCSKCGVQLPQGVAECCLCVCDALCVTLEANHTIPCLDDLTGEGICECSKVKTRVDWDPDQCAYVGSAYCGQISINVKFEIKQCGEDGTCYLCLSSACLGLTGSCPDQCQPFTPGSSTHDGSCGRHIHDCEQTGGWNASWTVDASGCGDLDCTSVVVTAECMERVNPAGSGEDRLCKNCDCVCKNICITYAETGFVPEDDCLTNILKATWDEEAKHWQATFTCPAGSQTLTIQILRNELTGCCDWKLVPSKGMVVSTAVPPLDPPDILTTQCPDADMDFDIDLGGGATATVHVECADCHQCDGFCCCQDDANIPDTLYATLGDETECCPCAAGVVFPITLQERTTSDLGIGGTWQGEYSVCGGTARVIFECDTSGAGCQFRCKLCMTPAGDCDYSLEEDCDEAIWVTDDEISAGCFGDNCCDPLTRVFKTSDSFNATCNCDGPDPPCIQGIDGAICVVITE